MNAAKHLLIAFDSCASGLAVQSKATPDPRDALLRTMSRDGSRMLLTAGTAEEKAFQVTVSNNQGYGVWTKAFLDVLRLGEADGDNKGFVTAEELHARIKTRVGRFAAERQRKMTPDWDELPSPPTKEYRGTFVFLNRKANNPRLSPQFAQVMKIESKGDEGPTETRLALALAAYNNLKDCSNSSAVRKLIDAYKSESALAWMIDDLQRRCLDWPAPPPGPQPGERKQNSKDGLYYVWIPPGTFQMGCSGEAECDVDEKPPHEVRISRGFWMGQTEVTVEAYERYRNKTGAAALPDKDFFGRKLNSAAGDPSLPALAMTWDEAKAYCEWAGMRLPTEAEWEYAARAGSTAARYGPLDQIAWYGDNSGRAGINSARLWDQDQAGYSKKLFENGNGPKSVRSKPLGANAWQLYDMLGNALEWTADWYDEKFYLRSSSSVDPHGPAEGKYRVLRGGSWFSYPRDVRASFRSWNEPAYRSSGIGVRCAGELR